jgi:hypothetical protein
MRRSASGARVKGTCRPVCHLHSVQLGLCTCNPITTTHVDRSGIYTDLRRTVCAAVHQQHGLLRSAVLKGVHRISWVAVRLEPAGEDCPADSAIQSHQLDRPSSIAFGPVQQIGADTEDPGHRDEEAKLETCRLDVAVVGLVCDP